MQSVVVFSAVKVAAAFGEPSTCVVYTKYSLARFESGSIIIPLKLVYGTTTPSIFLQYWALYYYLVHFNSIKLFLQYFNSNYLFLPINQHNHQK